MADLPRIVINALQSGKENFSEYVPLFGMVKEYYTGSKELRDMKQKYAPAAAQYLKKSAGIDVAPEKISDDQFLTYCMFGNDALYEKLRVVCDGAVLRGVSNFVPLGGKALIGVCCEYMRHTDLSKKIESIAAHAGHISVADINGLIDGAMGMKDGKAAPFAGAPVHVRDQKKIAAFVEALNHQISPRDADVAIVAFLGSKGYCPPQDPQKSQSIRSSHSCTEFAPAHHFDWKIPDRTPKPSGALSCIPTHRTH